MSTPLALAWLGLAFAALSVLFAVFALRRPQRRRRAPSMGYLNPSKTYIAEVKGFKVKLEKL